MEEVVPPNMAWMLLTLGFAVLPAITIIARAEPVGTFRLL